LSFQSSTISPPKKLAKYNTLTHAVSLSRVKSGQSHERGFAPGQGSSRPYGARKLGPRCCPRIALRFILGYFRSLPTGREVLFDLSARRKELSTITRNVHAIALRV
jgi:hypothetical protein